MRLSLCMIVKDEARFLPGCLASVAGVVDEVVIVDTGSTDATPSIAERSGARLERLPWADDFSAPRNLALECARGDWVLQLDADERLAPGAAAGLRAAMRSKADLGMVRLHDAAREDASAAEVLSGLARRGDPLRLPRLFRRRPGLRYRGVVHETVDEWLAERGALAIDVAADIIHLGAIPELRVARGKSERNLRLLERRCALEPESLTPLALLAAELLEGGRVAEAAAVAERGWGLLGRQPAWRSIHLLAVVRAQAASILGETSRVQETAETAARLEGSTSDLGYLQGCALELDSLRLAGRPSRDRLGAAVACYRGAVAPRPAEDARQLVQGSAGWAARVRLGTALLRLGEPIAARAEFEAAAAEAPDPTEARLGAVEARLDAGDPRGALQAVEPLLGPRPDGWILAAAAATAAGDAPGARELLAAAARRLGTGLIAPHRAARARALAGDPPPDFAALLEALLEDRAVAPVDRGAPVDLDRLRSVAARLRASGQGDLLERLASPTAERACPGLSRWVGAL